MHWRQSKRVLAVSFIQSVTSFYQIPRKGLCRECACTLAHMIAVAVASVYVHVYTFTGMLLFALMLSCNYVCMHAWTSACIRACARIHVCSFLYVYRGFMDGSMLVCCTCICCAFAGTCASCSWMQCSYTSTQHGELSTATNKTSIKCYSILMQRFLVHWRKFTNCLKVLHWFSAAAFGTSDCIYGFLLAFWCCFRKCPQNTALSKLWEVWTLWSVSAVFSFQLSRFYTQYLPEPVPLR